jgi:pyruvate formate lyase activating enzyme
MALNYADILDRQSREGTLYRLLPGSRVQCFACGHRCRISEGRRGVCKVRFNNGGRLFAPSGYVAALQCDPIEKKPFFHVHPGSSTLTFGMLGCDYHCGYCQNWLTSQTLRDPSARISRQSVEAVELVGLARDAGARMVTSSYNEPLITAEWAVEIFREAKRHGLLTAFVSNGNATPEVLDYLRPWTDCYKVDLKSMRDRNYRQLGGRLSVVLETIGRLKERGFWVEVVTLVVPGFNDSLEELGEAAAFLAGVSKDIPWHVTAFHPDYKMTDRGSTQVDTLLAAVRAGREAGLDFVYGGNLSGRVGGLENTVCPGCGELVVERRGYRILGDRLEGGRCPGCRRVIPGLWN